MKIWRDFSYRITGIRIRREFLYRFRYRISEISCGIGLQHQLQVVSCSIRADAQAAVVTVIGADNRAQLRTVQVGPTADTQWVITSGLKPGEQVVAVGADKVRDGQPVKPTPFKESEGR